MLDEAPQLVPDLPGAVDTIREMATLLHGGVERRKAAVVEHVLAIVEPGTFFPWPRWSDQTPAQRTRTVAWLVRQLARHVDARFAKLGTEKDLQPRPAALLDAYTPRKRSGLKTAPAVAAELILSVGAFGERLTAGDKARVTRACSAVDAAHDRITRVVALAAKKHGKLAVT
jgi:hypothetical protein